VSGGLSESPDVVLRYAGPPDGVVDVYLPPSLGRPARPHPLLVAVHGGFWRQAFDRTHLRPFASALARRYGFVVALPEYRRVGGSGGWPETAYDVASALAACPELIEAAAPGHLDAAAPCTLLGHSAGGHLALWAGLRAGHPRIGKIVALAPVSDVYFAATHRLGAGAVQELLGGEPADVPDRYSEADPLPMLPGDVPVTIIQGSEDQQVPAEMNRAVVDRHATGHSTAPMGSSTSLRYVEVAGVEHFALIDPLSTSFTSTVVPALTASSGS
jgi:acetyl esterase/lipase